MKNEDIVKLGKGVLDSQNVINTLDASAVRQIMKDGSVELRGIVRGHAQNHSDAAVRQEVSATPGATLLNVSPTPTLQPTGQPSRLRVRRGNNNNNQP